MYGGNSESPGVERSFAEARMDTVRSGGTGRPGDLESAIAEAEGAPRMRRDVCFRPFLASTTKGGMRYAASQARTRKGAWGDHQTAGSGPRCTAGGFPPHRQRLPVSGLRLCGSPRDGSRPAPIRKARGSLPASSPKGGVGRLADPARGGTPGGRPLQHHSALGAHRTAAEDKAPGSARRACECGRSRSHDGGGGSRRCRESVARRRRAHPGVGAAVHRAPRRPRAARIDGEAAAPGPAQDRCSLGVDAPRDSNGRATRLSAAAHRVRSLYGARRPETDFSTPCRFRLTLRQRSSYAI